MRTLFNYTKIKKPPKVKTFEGKHLKTIQIKLKYPKRILKRFAPRKRLFGS